MHKNVKQNTREFQMEGYKTLVGGILIQLFNGSFFLWASLSPYVLSYMYIFDKSINLEAIYYVEVALVVLNSIGFMTGSYMLNQLEMSPKVILTIGSSLSLFGIFASTFTTNIWAFVGFYGVFNGIGCGINYMIPLICTWEYFPQKKGSITGCIIGAYGLSAFIFVQISTYLANPLDKNATIKVTDDVKFFETEIAMNVPKMFRILGTIFMGLAVLSICLISRPFTKVEEEDFVFETDNYLSTGDQTE